MKTTPKTEKTPPIFIRATQPLWDVVDKLKSHYNTSNNQKCMESVINEHLPMMVENKHLKKELAFYKSKYQEMVELATRYDKEQKGIEAATKKILLNNEALIKGIRENQAIMQKKEKTHDLMTSILKVAKIKKS